MVKNKALKRVIEVGIKLTTENDIIKLLDTILNCAIELTNCDAGTLYLYKNNSLEFKIMKTISQNVNNGANGEKINLPPVPLVEGNVCAYSAIHKKVINIEDVYNSDRFDFSGPKKYDSITGFHTQSMLVVPLLLTDGELIGVLQLINSMDEDGNIGVFDSSTEFIVRSLASQAAVAIANVRYIREIKQQLHSFAGAFAKAIDQRTPYNGSHTRKVMEYATLLGEYLKKLHQEGKFEEEMDDERIEILSLSAALHDIGKMVVPLRVMNKATRLGDKLEVVKDRIEKVGLYLEIDYLKGRLSEEAYKKKLEYINGAKDFIEEIDGQGFLPDEKLARVDEIADFSYELENGEKLVLLLETEVDALKIKKGTLTAKEREVMESHVTMTSTILEEVHFQKQYKKVPYFAGSHHELLDGSGYPKHLTAAELELEPRILAIVDIYDALTCTDRPYKRPIPQDKAFVILEDMVGEGKLDGRLVQHFKAAILESQN